MCGYRSGATSSTRSRLSWGNSLISPLYWNSQFPWAKGWQLTRLVVPPSAARTWARNVWERICWASRCRLASFQAGRVSRYWPGNGRSPYHPTPNPSPLVGSAWWRNIDVTGVPGT